MPEQPSILLIEDEANLRHNLTVLLEGEGYRVACAEDGAEGMQTLQEASFKKAKVREWWKSGKLNDEETDRDLADLDERKRELQARLDALGNRETHVREIRDEARRMGKVAASMAKEVMALDLANESHRPRIRQIIQRVLTIEVTTMIDNGKRMGELTFTVLRSYGLKMYTDPLYLFRGEVSWIDVSELHES
jgi:CheY-like chemotaxis protein